ncbi:hypothetical protein KZZ52_12900 [Dactylosporangium sp. AC04546]|uniref:hypothetical protein n=1 Tax=Dactylosporangium sp. AC04546 TaxID=2862460 RepID=UPI001EDD1124|nr:hypothetical protein [Dactylosporangium sp. AC04546]WVK86236.1 hypothetical protein KZZ52_12900 [Dactylosporangium sp. AC04546]
MLPPAPAPDAVMFRTTPWRTAGYIAVTALAAWCGAATTIMIMSIATGGFWRGVEFAFSATVIAPAIVGSALGIWLGGAMRVWARVSAAGVELGNPRSLLIAWPDVETAVQRGRWIFTTVEVVLRHDAPVALQEAKGRLPRERVRAGRRGYPVWPALYAGGTDAFAAALREHGVEVRRP